MSKKVLMIGLDGATFTILGPMIDEGVMPVLGRLIREGVKGDLNSTRNPLTPPAWTSMVTGRSPHVHGIYDFLRPSTMDDGTVFLNLNDSRDVKAETVWSMANRQGVRATALNFWGHAPAPEIDGYIASGFVPWKHLRQGMHPKSLLDDVRAMDQFDYKNLGMDIGEEKKALQGLTDGEHDDWIELQSLRDTAWTDLCCHLMEKDRTGLTAVVLDGPDKLQHLFWRFVDPAYADSDDSEWFAQIRERCIGFFRQLDRNIERMVDAAGPDTDIFFTSDHGFGDTVEFVYLNEWLGRNGYLAWKHDDVGDTAQLTPDKIKNHLSMVDWQNTLAYCPTPSSNAIYVKRAKGDSHGVKDGEYLDFVLELRDKLLAYRDPADNGQVFVGVDTNKLEGTPYVEPSPDLTVHLRDHGFVSILKSTDVVIPRKEADGTHRPNGIFIGYGPSFASGATIEPIDILDMTPLMMYLLGLPVPNDLEGKVPEAALASSTMAERQVESGDATKATDTASGANRAEPTEEEREALLKQMKILGYMD